MFGMVCGLVSIGISLVSLVTTLRNRRKMRLFKKHILAARELLNASVSSYHNGDPLEAELQLAASNEELEKAQRYA
jgi:biopolymer transport protein ExbB/TolQ